MRVRRMLTLLIVVALIASCAPKPTATPLPPTKAPGAEPTAPPAAKKPKNGVQWVVGWTPLSDPVDEGRIAFDKGIRDAVENAAGKLLYCSPSPKGGATGDPALQANCIDNFIAQNVDAIVMWPIDIDAAVGPIEKANKAGIPVFLFFTVMPKKYGVNIAMSLKNPNEAGCLEAAEATAKALTEKYGSPKGLVLEVTGLMTAGDGLERNKFFHEAIDKYPNIEVVTKYADWDLGKATNIMKDWMTAHPETDAIYMHTEGTYLHGAKAVLEPIGRWVKIGQPGHVILTAVDGLNLAFNSIKCGYMEATSDLGYGVSSWALGGQVINYLKTGVLPKPGTSVQTADATFPEATVSELPDGAGLILQVKPILVTKDNADNPGLFGNKFQGPPNGLSPCQ